MLFVRAGDRGRTGDLVLGKPIDSGHHTISAHPRPGKLRVSPRSTTHGLGSIAAQSGTHLVHTVSTRANTLTPFYGVPTNPCDTPFTSLNNPVTTPLGLIAVATVPVEPGGSNEVMVPSGARRKP